MSKTPRKPPKTGIKPETCNPPLSIPLPFADAVRGLMAVDPRQLPSRQAGKKEMRTISPTVLHDPKKKHLIPKPPKKTGKK